MSLNTLLLLGAVVGVTARRIPGGRDVADNCIIQVENGAVYNADGPKMVTECDTTVAAPEVQIYAADVHLDSTAPLTSFFANWDVPPLPTSRGPFGGQVVYFWPGFKSKQPEMGYPVLQPVLQFGERGPEWALQSWFVDARDPTYPVVTAPSISVKAGDKLTSFMSLSDDGKTWTVSGSNTNTGENSTLHIAFKEAGDTTYDYAMLVNENVNVNTRCSLMPASTNVTFTNLSVNGTTPTWTTRANCANDPACDCDNKATVLDNGDVVLSWNSKK